MTRAVVPGFMGSVREDDLRWRVERACLAAWPPARLSAAGDWWIASGGGPTRRSNAAHPRLPGARLDAGALAQVERGFADAGQVPLLRIPDFVAHDDELLRDAGYDAPEGASRTLTADLDALPPPPAAHVTLTSAPDTAWLDTRAAVVDRRADDEATVARLTLPARFAAVRAAGAVAAVGCGMMTEGVLVLEAIAVLPNQRRRGFGRALVTALLGWGRDAGADCAALQVEAANAPARTLYAGLGFTRDLYGYHYRRRNACPSA